MRQHTLLMALQAHRQIAMVSNMLVNLIKQQIKARKRIQKVVSFYIFITVSVGVRVGSQKLKRVGGGMVWSKLGTPELWSRCAGS